MSGVGAQNARAAAAPPQPDWATLIGGAPAPPIVRAATFLRPFDSDTKPVEVLCDDGMAYVVKALWADVNHRPKNARIKEPRNDAEQGRRMFNEQVCGRLGMMMNAPVPSITLINLPQPLIEANPEGMGHLKPCNAHGSMTIPNVSGAVGGFDHADKGDNRERYCRLAVLFGWLVHGDMQFLRGTDPPHAVYSHDHAHFFPGGPIWSEASLVSCSTPASPVSDMVAALKLTPEELSTACAALAAITVANIATAVAAAPAEWLVSSAERIAIAQFLYSRQISLIKAPQSEGAVKS